MEKEFKVRYSKTRPNAYEVYLEGGGEVPQVLTGAYTSPGVAERAIAHYLDTRRVRKSTKAA